MTQGLGSGRYGRLPTRKRLQLGWIGVALSFFTYQVLHLTIMRVQPKREELVYTILQREFPDGNIPAQILDQVQALREMREGLSLHVALATPTPGQFQVAMMDDMDPTRLGNLRR